MGFIEDIPGTDYKLISYFTILLDDIIIKKNALSIISWTSRLCYNMFTTLNCP